MLIYLFVLSAWIIETQVEVFKDDLDEETFKESQKETEIISTTTVRLGIQLMHGLGKPSKK